MRTGISLWSKNSYRENIEKYWSAQCRQDSYQNAIMYCKTQFPEKGTCWDPEQPQMKVHRIASPFEFCIVTKLTVCSGNDCSCMTWARLVRCHSPSVSKPRGATGVTDWYTLGGLTVVLSFPRARLVGRIYILELDQSIRPNWMGR